MKLSENEQKYEEKHLDDTIKIIRTKISELGQELYDKEEKIQEFKELIWDSKHDMDPAEMRFMMAQSDDEVIRAQRKGKYFQTLYKIQGKPYFGMIKFEDNDKVIRNIEDKTLIVQGIAGSGKTSVALHRIAFLLYKLKNLSSNNVLIFSPNKVFSEYISNVLPELGEDNTLQTTFTKFMESNLYEYRNVEEFTKFIERFYKDKNVDKELITFKQSDEIIPLIDEYIKNYVKDTYFVGDLDTRDFTYTKDELNYFLHERYNHMKFYEILPIIATKICDTYYKGKKNNHKKLVAALTKLLNKPKDIKTIYKNFYTSKYFTDNFKRYIYDKEIDSWLNTKTINYEDACIMIYMKGLLEGFDYKALIKQVVIDEAQDYSKLQYKIIKEIFRQSGFTILGDINQTINPYYKYNSLEDLKEIFNEDNKYLELTKTYRSSEEIIEYTNKILGLEYVSAIRKSNNHPVIYRDNNNLKDNLINDINNLKKEFKSIAIITKTDEEAEYIYNLLKEDLSTISLLNSNTEKFNRDLIVVPAYTAKGLEFDSVIIYTDKDNKYLETEKYLYYVACTRAQHQLIVYNQ